MLNQWIHWWVNQNKIKTRLQLTTISMENLFKFTILMIKNRIGIKLNYQFSTRGITPVHKNLHRLPTIWIQSRFNIKRRWLTKRNKFSKKLKKWIKIWTNSLIKHKPKWLQLSKWNKWTMLLRRLTFRINLQISKFKLWIILVQ